MDLRPPVSALPPSVAVRVPHLAMALPVLVSMEPPAAAHHGQQQVTQEKILLIRVELEYIRLT